MKNDVYESLKARKPFEKWDVIAYVFILVLLLCLSIFFVFTPTEKSSGFKVELDGREIFNFYYDDCSYNSFHDFDIDVDLSNNIITIYFDNAKTDYNVLEFSSVEKSVKVTESTCSASKECVHIPAIKNSLGSIYCTPHKLKITSLGGVPSGPVTGA